MTRKKSQIAVRIPAYLMDLLDTEVAGTASKQTAIVTEALERYLTQASSATPTPTITDSGLLRLLEGEREVAKAIEHLRYSVAHINKSSAKQQVLNALHALCMAQTKLVLTQSILE